jgi:hypothetical protein
MTLAFDTVCRSLLAKESDNDDIRRKLALIILHHTDRARARPGAIGGPLVPGTDGLRNGDAAMTASRCSKAETCWSCICSEELGRVEGVGPGACVTVFSGHAAATRSSFGQKYCSCAH